MAQYSWLKEMGFVYAGEHSSVDITYFRHPSGATVEIGPDAFRPMEYHKAHAPELIRRHEDARRLEPALAARYGMGSYASPDLVAGVWEWNVMVGNGLVRTIKEAEVSAMLHTEFPAPVVALPAQVIPFRRPVRPRVSWTCTVTHAVTSGELIGVEHPNRTRGLCLNARGWVQYIPIPEITATDSTPWPVTVGEPRRFTVGQQ